MTHPLYLQVSRTIGMRRLATAAVYGALLDAFPWADFTVRGEGVLLTVTFRLPWWVWLFLIPALVVYLQARRVARAKLTELRMASVMRLKIEVE